MHFALRPSAARPRGSLPLALLAVPLLAAALAGPAHAQARVSVTILDHDETLCRQQMMKSGVDRNRPWWCVIGMARHPVGVSGVSVGGARALLLADSAGGTRFVGLLPPGGEARHLSIVVEGRDGQSGAEHYRLTPGVVDLANPERQTYVLTNLRPRVLGGGDPLAPLPEPEPQRVAQAAPPAAPPSAPPAQPSPTPAQPAAGAAVADAGGAAAPAAALPDPADEFIRIMEPREWSGYGTRGVTTPVRRSVRVVGYAQHPGGVATVEIDGRPASLTREASGSVRFVGFVAADSGAREVAVTVRGQSGLPVMRHFSLSGDPTARAFASREEPWSAEAGFRGKRWAVVVGVSAYQDSAIRPLRFADDDARAFHDFLRSPRAGGGGFAEENVKLLLNERATFAEVRTALMSFLRQATPEDQVIIYFAGHGEPDPLRPSDLYLLTHDTRFDQLSSTAFPMRDLQRAVEELSAKHVLLITDACHSGGITGQHLATRGSANQINQAFLAQLSASTGGLAVFTASQASQPSLEDERWGGGHGVFTHYLLEALRGGADENGDQIVTLVDAMHWTIEKVRRETGNAQVPMIGNHTYDMNLPVAMVLRDDEVAPKPDSIVDDPRRIAGTGEIGGGDVEKRAVPPALADSLAHARRAVETFPNSARYRSTLGQILVRAGMLEEGIAALREAIRLDPQNPEFHASLARSLGEAKLVRESLEAWERAVTLDPQSAAFQHASGDALLAAGQTDAALERLRRAVRMNGSQAAYHGSLGRGLRAAGRAREAVTVLKTAVTLDAGSAEHRRELAQALTEDGRAGEGIAELQEAARLAPADAAVRAELAAFLRNAGRLPEARAALVEAVRIDSADAGYRSALGRVLQESGLKYEATLEFETAVRLDPKNARHHYALGTLLVGSNEQAKALDALQEAVRLDPASALYHNALGQALRAATRPAEALQALMQAVALEPTEPRYHFDLGTMYAETGSYPQALASLQAANRLARDNAEYQAALRDVQRRLRN